MDKDRIVGPGPHDGDIVGNLECQLFQVRFRLPVAPIDMFIGIPRRAKFKPASRVLAVKPGLQSVDDIGLCILKIGETVSVFIGEQRVMSTIRPDVGHEIIRQQHDRVCTGIQSDPIDILQCFEAFRTAVGPGVSQGIAQLFLRGLHGKVGIWVDHHGKMHHPVFFELTAGLGQSAAKQVIGADTSLSSPGRNRHRPCSTYSNSSQRRRRNPFAIRLHFASFLNT